MPTKEFYLSAFVLALLILFTVPLSAESASLVNFKSDPLPSFVSFKGSSPAEIKEEGLLVNFQKTEWPRIVCQAPEGGWDWSDRIGLGFKLHNPGDTSIAIALRVDNAGADGSKNCNTLLSTIEGGESLDFRMALARADKTIFWGMRGIPAAEAPYGSGDALDLSAITAFQLFLPEQETEAALLVKEAFLFGTRDEEGIVVSMPFVDPFGQFNQGQWPGKIEEEAEFQKRLTAEQKELVENKSLPGRDSFGGWLEGPQLKATGWFRTEEIDGKWWLVTPEGRLFISLGVNCVRAGEHSFIEAREKWFEWLPPKDDPLFHSVFSHAGNVHSMAETIGGSGATFSFYLANVLRKYGEDWKEGWAEMNFARLQSWGFNTIGNWSHKDILDASPLPFTTSITTGNAPRIEAAQGYWGKILDPYHPDFEEKVEPTIAAMTKPYKDNPLCIGYFVDNELAWEGAIAGVLASGPEQPARQVLLQQLHKGYATLEDLNKAWRSEFTSWDDIDRPRRRSDAFKADMDRFLYNFAYQYFTTVNHLLKKHAPNQLYLGCRFSSTPEQAVRACAAVADVVSVNIYTRAVAPDKWTGEKSLGKPMLIGEFHFGALDRGMFHTGLVATKDQNDRAEHYKAYVRSVVEHPAFVGSHWFQWVDQSSTGRTLDGENYNIGFLDVTDTPYPELVEAAKEIHKDAYGIRYGGG
ncbi:MAG: hypothetical protein GX130_07945 [Candidatus Hydrogenedens sp.]|jgi:hypothetical protein|nr:hypothetical protein [Candidatus Hydrogenedens sp.]